MFLLTKNWLVLHGLAHLAQAMSSDLPTPSDVIITQRQPDMPTITLWGAAMDDSHPTRVRRQGTVPSGSPGKRQIRVDPPDLFINVPESGATITFGEDITSDAGRIVKEKCPSGLNIDACSGELGTLLQNAHLGKRFEMILGENRAFAFLTTMVNLVIQNVREGKYSSKEAKFQLEKEDIKEIRSMRDSPEFAMIFPGGDWDFQTMTTAVKAGPSLAPEIRPEDKIRMEEVTEDKNDNKKGDLLIYYPARVAKILEDSLKDLDLIDESREICRDERNRALGRKRQVVTWGSDCMRAVIDATRTLISATGMKNLDAMVADVEPAMNFETAPDGALFPKLDGKWFGDNVFNGAVLVLKGLQSLPMPKGTIQVPAAKQVVIAGVSTTLVAGIIVNTQGLLTSTVTTTLAVLHSENSVEKVKSGDKNLKCPPDLICMSDDCRGYLSNPLTGELITQFGFCTTKESAMCFCRILHEVKTRFFDSLILNEMESIYMQQSAEYDCAKEGRIMDTARMNEAFRSGCQSHSDLKRRLLRDPDVRGSDLERRKNNFEWKNKDKDGLEWFLRWDDASDESCPLKCDDVFNLMVNKDKCRWYGNAAQKGKVKTECGTASYEVLPAARRPKLMDSKPGEHFVYEIVVEQQIKENDWKIRWELFASPWANSEKMDGPSSSLEVGSTVDFVMTMTVDYPENRHESKIRFTLTDRNNPSQKKETSWLIGMDKDFSSWGTKGFWTKCYSKELWHDDKGIWRRKAACTFPSLLAMALSDVKEPPRCAFLKKPCDW